MDFDTTEKPFPYLMIRNFYTEEELRLMWLELDFWASMNKLLPPKETGQIIDGKKRNKGVFLDSAYSNRDFSNILAVNRRVYSKEVIEAYSDLHFTYKTVTMCNKDTTLLSYYEDSDYYHGHSDFAVATSLTWLYREPKSFTGGDLVFPDYNHTIHIENNMMVMFPSVVVHEVPKIQLVEGTEVGKGMGRFCISSFASFKD